MNRDKEEFLLNHKRECLLEEYKALNSELQFDSNISMSIKNWCITVWLISFGLAYQSKINPLSGAFAIIVAIAVFWLVNIFYSYHGLIHRKRFNQVCSWLNQVSLSTAEDVSQWQTPANPFKGISTGDKIRTILKSAISPLISIIYISLIMVTCILFIMLPRR